MKFKLQLNLQRADFFTQVADLLGEVSESAVVELQQEDAVVIVELPESSTHALMSWYGWSSSRDVNEFILEYSIR